ncbi:MAG: ATP-binding cassette domain-containing protein [Candidatus Eremiobacterota bacterium]
MIHIKNLHKKFNRGTANEVYALKDINLNIQEGDFVTVIGTNGSGKSTLLNGIAGSFLPDSGTIEIAGCDVTAEPDYRRARFISRCFQDPFKGTSPNMTVAENLHMAWLRGKNKFLHMGLNKDRIACYREHITHLEMKLEDRLNNLIGSLSGGQRQALTLLMAVITKPKVLLLDEHTAALDPKSAAQVVELTRKFIDRDHLTVLMVTHSMQQALELGNMTVMMHGGQVIDILTEKDKKQLTVKDLLDKFDELRKSEALTEEMVKMLENEYR